MKKIRKILGTCYDYFFIFLKFLRSKILIIPSIIYISKQCQNKKIVISMHPSIGDTLFTCSLLKEFILENNYQFTLYVPKIRQNIVDRYHFKNVYYYNNSVSLLLYSALHSSFARKILNKKLGKSLFVFYPWYYINRKKYKEYDTDCFKLLKERIFKLKNNNPIIDYVPVKEKPISIDTSKKFIIFNNFSFSEHLPNSIFEHIAKKLNDKGYICYTNTFGDQKEIPGTISFNSSLDELAIASKYASAVVSIRTGGLDYIISYAKRIYAIYDNIQDYHMYNLSQWQTKCELHEYIFNKKKPEEFDVEKIVEDILKSIKTI